MKKTIISLALLLMAANVHAESIQLSTYYPSPFGLYDRLRLVPRAALSDPCDSGTIYVRNTDNALQFCGASSTWGSFAGPWTESGNTIYATNTSANVGIGTTSPTERLHVAGGNILLDDNYSIKWGGGSTKIEGENPNNKLHFTTNNIERMIIDNNGNVGIGTTSPMGGIGLHLKTPQWSYSTAAGMIIQAAAAGDSPGLMLFDSNNYEKGAFGLASLVQNWSYDALVGDVVLRSSNGRLIFSTESIAASPPYPAPPNFRARMLIDQSGNVGIGIITPNNLLQVKDLINFDNTRYGTSLGYQAGLVNTGNYNTFVGYQSGLSNTSGYENTFLGYGSGISNTTGYENVFLGKHAGTSNTTGNSNVFLGEISGQSNTTGNNNTFIGNQSGRSNTTGNDNTFAGYASGLSNTGSKNTFIGYATGQANTALGNTFIGYATGYSNTTGAANTFVGEGAGSNNTTGSTNTLIGKSAGQFLTDGSGNTFIGGGTGINTTTGMNNTFIGDNAGVTNTTGFQNIIIGWNIDLPSPTTSNFLTIGGIINGDLTTGNVGIGTVNPLSKLAVTGLQNTPPDASGTKGVLCITNDGNIWIDDDNDMGVGSVCQ